MTARVLPYRIAQAERKPLPRWIWLRARWSRLKGWLCSREVRITVAAIVGMLVLLSLAFADPVQPVELRNPTRFWRAVALGVGIGLLIAGSFLAVGNALLSDLKAEGKVTPGYRNVKERRR